MNQNTANSRKPTVGRIVNFHPNGDHRFNGLTVALAAVIAYVHSDQLVNLTVFGPNGETYPATSVSLMGDGFDITTRTTGDGCFAAWPQFQPTGVSSFNRDPNTDAPDAKVFNAGGQVAGPGLPIDAGPQLAAKQDDERAVITEQDLGRTQTQVDQEGLVERADPHAPQRPFDVAGANVEHMGASSLKAAGIVGGEDASRQEPFGAEQAIEVDATGGPVPELKAPEQVTGVAVAPDNNGEVNYLANVGEPMPEKVAGANIHGLGPDTAGGPNPDYNPDA